MRRIYKLRLPDDAPGYYDVHVGVQAKLLKVALQDRMITMWFECDPDAICVPYNYCVMWTGQDVPEHYYYIDTLFQDNGTVLHVYGTRGQINA